MTSRHRVIVSVAALVAAMVMLLTTCRESDRESSELTPTPRGATPAPRGLLSAGRVPMPTDYFVENVGQVANGEVLYYHRAGGIDIGFGEGSIWLKMLEPVESGTGRSPGLGSPRLPAGFGPGAAGGGASPRRGVALRLRFEGSNSTRPEVRGEMPFRTNYLLGADPSGHRSGIRAYEEIVYADLYDGIDLVLRPDTRGLKYELHLRPGASIESLALTYEGTEGLDLSAEGEVVIRTELGDLRDAAPVARDGWGVALDCAFDLRGPRSYGLVCPGWGGESPLVIDPLISGTFLGGGETDRGQAIAVDPSGNAYVMGDTASASFPAPGGFDLSLGGLYDAFVAKISPTGGSLIYGTYLGGSDDETGGDIAVDASGHAYVTGYTRSSDFPVTVGALDTALGGRADAFVAKIDPTGGNLLYGTYLGGAESDFGSKITLDASRNACITGDTLSPDFPTTSDGLDTSLGGGVDAFVAKIDLLSGALLYGTYLGGSDRDQGIGIAVDASGNMYVTGLTTSTDFPTTLDGLDTSLGGGMDAFVAKIDLLSGALLYGTYLGGTGDEFAWGIAVGASGSAYVTGTTDSTDFPAPGGFDETLDGVQDGFVAKINPTGETLLYGTYIGGSRGDNGVNIAVDISGNAYVIGGTSSDDFPTPGGFDTSYGGVRDAFVAKVDPTGEVSLLYGSYLGGSAHDEGRDIALDAFGNAWVTGVTRSLDFPTPAGYDTQFDGIRDAFVAKLSLRPPCPPPDDPMRLRRMDTLGRVEGVDPDFDEAMLADLVFPFNNLGFGGLGSFPDFGGGIVKLYFEFPDGVSEFSALTIFDRYDPSLPAGDPCSCFVTDAGADIFTGPDIHAVEAWDGGATIYADEAPIFHPGERRYTPFPLYERLTDNEYGADNGDPDCDTYDHLYGTDAGLLPRLTSGLAGIASDLVGAPNADGIGVGHLFDESLYDGAGNVTGPLDCNGDGVADRAYAPVYQDPAPGGKEAWPGFVSLGCGGTITVNFSAPAKPKSGSGTAGADIVIYALGGFDAALDGPLALVGSSTPVGPVNTNTNGGPALDCGQDPPDTGKANLVITNESASRYQSGGNDPFGFEFEKYVIRVVDTSGTFGVQEEEILNDPISPELPGNTRTLGPYDVTCQSVFYFYAFGDDDSYGNPDDDDGDGVFGSLDENNIDLDDHPEQVFASDMDVTGISFLGYTGIYPEPTCYKGPTEETPSCPGPKLTTAGRAVPVLNGGDAADWTLYAFSTGTPVGSVRVESAARVRIRPRTLNRKSHGKWVTLDVRTKGGFKATDIDPATVVVEGLERGVSVPAMHPSVASRRSLKLKVSRRNLAALLEPGDEVLVTVRGLTFSGEAWSAQDVIRVIH